MTPLHDITPGEGIGPVQLSMSLDEVEAALPDLVVHDAEVGWYRSDQHALDVWVDDAGALRQIGTADRRYTLDGLRTGNTVGEFQRMGEIYDTGFGYAVTDVSGLYLEPPDDSDVWDEASGDLSVTHLDEVVAAIYVFPEGGWVVR